MSKEESKQFAKTKRSKTDVEVTLKADHGRNKAGEKIMVNKSIVDKLKQRKII